MRESITVHHVIESRVKTPCSVVHHFNSFARPKWLSSGACLSSILFSISSYESHDITMNDLTPLNRPVQSQVKIDPAAKECPSEGFNVRNEHCFQMISIKLSATHSIPLSANSINTRESTSRNLSRLVLRHPTIFSMSRTQRVGLLRSNTRLPVQVCIHRLSWNCLAELMK
jgi:hypothetical protein